MTGPQAAKVARIAQRGHVFGRLPSVAGAAVYCALTHSSSLTACRPLSRAPGKLPLCSISSDNFILGRDGKRAQPVAGVSRPAGPIGKRAPGPSAINAPTAIPAAGQKIATPGCARRAKPSRAARK